MLPSMFLSGKTNVTVQENFMIIHSLNMLKLQKVPQVNLMMSYCHSLKSLKNTHLNLQTNFTTVHNLELLQCTNQTLQSNKKNTRFDAITHYACEQCMWILNENSKCAHFCMIIDQVRMGQ